MKPLHPKSPRDVLLLGGVTLMALIPLFLLGCKSPVKRALVAPQTNTSFQYPPLFANNIGSSSSHLSPDGHWIARYEVAAQLLGQTSAPGTPSPRPDEMVIRSARTGKEAFRMAAIGEFVGWTPNSLGVITKTAGDINICAPAIRKPGMTPSKLWSQKTLSFGLGGDANEMQDGTIGFSSDLRYAVKSVWGDGPINWQIIDLKTGRVFPKVRAGEWFGRDPRRSGGEDLISVAIAPAPLSSGGQPIVAVLQSKASPLPHFLKVASLPTPIPGPTPTYSPLQIKIKAKQDKELAEVQKLVDSVVGVDGADPEVTDEEEIARITAEVKRRDAALEAERRSYFPLSNPTPTPTPKISLWELVKRFQLDVFDLSTHKLLWSSTLQGDIGLPSIQFSPDGSALIASGTAALSHENGFAQVTGVGLEFRQPRTGRVLKKTSFYEANPVDVESRPLAFYAAPASAGKQTGPSVMVIEDFYKGFKTPDGKSHLGEQAPAFRFFYPASGREIGYLKMDGSRFPQSDLSGTSFSVSQSGQTWLIGNEAVFVVSRKQLGQFSHGPLPLPTPTPFPIHTKHYPTRG